MFKFNSNTPKKILFNGLNVAKLVYRTVTVWVEKILTTLTNNSNVNVWCLLLDDSVGENVVDYKMYGHTWNSSSRTPSPENPVTITSSGLYDEATGKYRFPLKLSNNNVFDITKMPEIIGTEYVRNGDIIELALTSSNSINIGVTIGEVCPELKVGDEFTLYIETTAAAQIWIDRANKLLKSGDTYTATSAVLNSNIYIYGIKDGKSTISKIRFYNNVKSYDIYLDEPLRRQDDTYTDYIDFENQKVVRNLGSWVLTGYEEGWGNSYNPNYTTDEILCLTNMQIYKEGIEYHASYTGGWCNKFTYNSQSTTINKFRFSSGVYLFLTLDRTLYPEFTDEVRDVIAGTEIIYILKTPKEEAIELPEVETVEGENLISMSHEGTSGALKKFTATYYKRGN